MALKASPRFWTILAAGLWALWWALLASAFVFKQNYDALWVLGIFSTPSSLIVSGLSRTLGDAFALTVEHRFFLDLGGFLIFGSAQYCGIGYLFGKGVQWFCARGDGTT
jgi:hypothetical protein